MFKHTLHYATANYLVQVLGMVNSIILRRFLGPTSMGIWSFLQVILGYCGYASFGTTRALARDYPYYRGRGEHEKAEELKDLTLTFSMVMSIIPAFILLVYLIAKWPVISPPLRFGLTFLLFFLFVQRFYDLLMTLLRSDKKFEILSLLMVINAMAGLGVSLLLVSSWNIYGLCIGTAAVTFGCLWFIEKNSRYHFRYFWDLRALWKELKLGLPLLLNASLFTLLTSLDKLILTRKLGFYEVGLFSIAGMAHSYIASLPMMFSHVWYPNLQEEYGNRGTASGIRNFLQTPVITLSFVMPFLCGVVIFLFPLVIRQFMGEFISGIPAMKIYLIGSFFLLLGQFSGSFLVTLDKYLVSTPILLASAGLNFSLNLMFVHMGWGLKGVAAGTAMSLAFYGMASYGVALAQFTSWRGVVKNLAGIFFVASAFFATIFILDHWLGDGRHLLRSAGVKLFCFIGISLVFFSLGEKKTRLLASLAQVFSQKKKEATRGNDEGAVDLSIVP